MNNMDNCIKILHANDDNHNLGGAFLITYRVEKCLREIGFSYDYLTMDTFDVEDTDYPMPQDDRVYSANLRHNRLIGHIRLPFYVRRLLLDNKYEIIHIDSDSAWKALLYAIPAKRAGLKVVVHSHSTGIDGDAKKIKMFVEMMAKPFISKYVDRIIACSKEAARWMSYKNDISQVRVIYNGVDFDKYYFNLSEREQYRKKYEISDDTIVLGNVATITYNKNQLFAVDVLAELVKQSVDTRLFFVGDDSSDYARKVKEKVNTLGLANFVVFVGKTSDVRQYLNMMDVCLHPSFFEGAPLALYEAQATGLPCVINDTISRDVVVSSWCETNSIELGAKCWAGVVISIVNRYKKERFYRKLSEKYSIKGMAFELANVYKDLMS